ncbi:MAG TPA: hypothetical protein VJH23_03260 [archaeon]|nr:hypothetical protein [archaeon]
MKKVLSIVVFLLVIGLFLTAGCTSSQNNQGNTQGQNPQGGVSPTNNQPSNDEGNTGTLPQPPELPE